MTTFIALISTRDQYNALFSVYVPIAAGVFVIVVLVVFGAVLRYRGRAPQAAARWSESNRLEAGYAAFLVFVVAFLLFLTFSAEHRVDTVANRERPTLTVDVIGAKWEWEFDYPRYGIVRRSGTVGRQPLVVPAGQAIRFNLTSLDVIHSFWIPELEYKHDLIPGSVQHQVLTFTRTGLFSGQCAEFCGLRHADMVFSVRVVTPSVFSVWAHSKGQMTF
ncbi:MAG: cytochrome c oxidase subunit II [Solirubrobacteraceae bacterium]